MYTAIYLLRDVIWPVYKLRKVFTVCLGLRSLRRREIISCKIIFTINVDILLAITQNRLIRKLLIFATASECADTPKVFTVRLGLCSSRRRRIMNCNIIFTNFHILLAITQNRRIAKAAYLIFIKNKSVSTHV